ncbi:NEN1-like protein, partial [Tanacetum coccineum]
MVSITYQPGIVFFDLETTIKNGGQYAILEFESILLSPKTLTELKWYETLVRPHDLYLITENSIRKNGITVKHVEVKPMFSEIADREEYRPRSEPKEIIDTVDLLTKWFGTRAGDMEMATLTAYFGHGRQRHR